MATSLVYEEQFRKYRADNNSRSETPGTENKTVKDKVSQYETKIQNANSKFRSQQ